MSAVFGAPSPSSQYIKNPFTGETGSYVPRNTGNFSNDAAGAAAAMGSQISDWVAAPQSQPQSQAPLSFAPPTQAASTPVAPIGPPDAPPMTPMAPPPALQTGPIQNALGIPPTDELANKYRYNPWWKPI